VTEVSICVCTFQRPDGLRRLLRSLHRLDPATPTHEIIVVDNDAEMTAEPIVRQARAEGLPVQYLVEPVRGIARARNRSLEPASGEFVAFIDDDEEADPQWLVRLWGEVMRHGDDGGFGPVLPKFNEHTPRWLIEGGFFERPRFPTGTILFAWQTRTGNALVRRRPLMALAGPFDERYDLTGGEDTDLFARLIRCDCRFIAVDSAVVYEHLPPSRTTLRWLLQRRFLTGMGGARLYTATVPAAARARWQRARPLLSGLGWGVVGLLLWPLFRVYGVNRLALSARYLGRFAFHSGFSFQAYARESWR
jgi:glycosyltransferase involved in cell wall biosynthesis